MPLIRPLLPVLSFALITSCSSGGGGGEPAPVGPPTGASVPEGAGQVAIDMVGTWEIRNVTVLDTNDPTLGPPLEGSIYELAADRIVSILGLSVDPAVLALLLGAPLDNYVNEADGRTIFYSVLADRREAGNTREEVDLAAGAVDDDTIAVEFFTSTQAPGAEKPSYIVARYQLVRVDPNSTAPVIGDSAVEDLSDQDHLHAAFGRR